MPSPKPAAPALPAPRLAPRGDASRRRLRRVFVEGFTVMDVAEPLASFDAERPAAEVRAHLSAHGLERVGVRTGGHVTGFVERDDLAGAARCGDRARPFGPDDLVAETASLQEVIQSLAANGRCFVTVLGEVAAVVTLRDLEKPPVRMFIFGMVTVLEMLFVRTVEAAYPGERWTEHVPEGRLAKARELQAERLRRGSPARLLDCLQFSDKGQLVLRLPEALERLGLSRKAGLRALAELQELRNNLAHGQEIIPDGWARIVVFSQRLDALLDSL